MSEMETDAKEPAGESESESEWGSKSGSGSPPVSSQQEDIAPVPPPTPTSTSSSSSPSFSQLLAGAMSPRGAQPMVAMPIDGGVGLPMVAVLCFLPPTSLLDSSGFTKDVIVCVLPLFHIYSLNSSVLQLCGLTDEEEADGASGEADGAEPLPPPHPPHPQPLSGRDEK